MGVSNGPSHEISSYNGTTYNYIADSYLAKASAGNNSYTLFYDALGRCVKRTTVTNGGTPVTNYYVFDGEHWVVEYNANGTAQSNVAYGNGMDEVIARGVNGQGWWYFPDRNGNISVVTDGVNTVRESYRYDAFGLPTVTVGAGQTAINNRFLFTGREWNANFGFYEYRARAYNPTLGRFMSEDPKGFDAGDYNLYRYCNNDPLDRVDPMGLLDFVYDASFPRDAQVEFKAAIQLGKTTSARGKELAEMPGTVKVFATNDRAPTGANPKSMRLFLEPKDPSFLDKQSREAFKKFPSEKPPDDAKGRAVTVFHELGHFTGAKDENKGGHNVRDNENPVREGLKLPDRKTYQDVPVYGRPARSE
jgi:RHS repeat-associated protein